MKMQSLTEQKATEYSALYDSDLPTVKDVLIALSGTATQYAVKPSKDLAELALRLANSLKAPEYNEIAYTEKLANQLSQQWARVVDEYRYLEISILAQNTSIQ